MILNSDFNFSTSSHSSLSFVAATIPSSTYNANKTFSEFLSRMNSNGSASLYLNPRLVKKLTTRLFQHLGACFDPCKLLFSLHTLSVLSEKPSGCCIQISSLRSPYKKAVETLNCNRCILSPAATLNRDLIVAFLTTGLKV